MSVQYNKKGISFMLLKTTDGQKVMVEDEDAHISQNNILSKDINLADNGAAVVGFRGACEDRIESLAILTAQRNDAPLQKRSSKR